MDEIRWEPDDWCEQARQLIESGEQGEGEFLTRLLGHIDAGIRLRRPLDHRPPDAASEGCRRAILRRLTKLRHFAALFSTTMNSTRLGTSSQGRTTFQEIACVNRRNPRGCAQSWEGASLRRLLKFGC